MKYTERRKWVGGVFSGMGGGKAGITMLMPLCLVVIGGVGGEELAEQAGEIFYEWIP